MTRRANPYVVRVQAQGSGLSDQKGVPLVSTQPIKAGLVNATLSAVWASLPADERGATGTAFARATQWVSGVAEGGGIGPIGSTSFTNGVDPGSVYRVDIEVLSGDRNIVP